MAKGIIIGVDGGGTKTVAAAMRYDGTLLGFERGDGINFNNIGMDRARQNLRRVVDGLLRACGEQTADLISVGMSAVDGECAAAATAAFAGELFDPARVLMHSDAYAALMSATMGGGGMIVICGTGSMILRVDDDGRQNVYGGWGYLLGDDLSSYTLAIDGMKRAIAAWEGVGERTALGDALMEHFSLAAPRDMIGKMYALRFAPQEAAKFAKTVLCLAREGDAAAKDVVEENIARLAALAVSAAGGDMPRTVWLYGGVFEHNAWVRDEFARLLASDGQKPSAAIIPYSPSVGAAVYGLRRRHLLTPQTHANIDKSYRELWQE